MEFLVLFNTLVLILAGSLLTWSLLNKRGRFKQPQREKK